MSITLWPPIAVRTTRYLSFFFATLFVICHSFTVNDPQARLRAPQLDEQNLKVGRQELVLRWRHHLVPEGVERGSGLYLGKLLRNPVAGHRRILARIGHERGDIRRARNGSAGIGASEYLDPHLDGGADP